MLLSIIINHNVSASSKYDYLVLGYIRYIIYIYLMKKFNKRCWFGMHLLIGLINIFGCVSKDVSVFRYAQVNIHLYLSFLIHPRIVHAMRFYMSKVHEWLIIYKCGLKSKQIKLSALQVGNM